MNRETVPERQDGVPSGSRSAVPVTGGDVLQLAGISKTYGVTKALQDVSLTIRRGEIIGLIGHNGAGKSTLMRVIVGITEPDAGTRTVDGNAVGPDYSMQESRAHGVRIAYQELSLAPELKVFENVFISAPSVGGWRWRQRSRAILRAALDEVFPGHGIPIGQQVRHLSLAQQQMLEITQATLEPAGPFALLILDEPTSALGGEQANNLFRHLERLKAKGISTVLISHKLHEILGHTDRVVVMRDGRVVSEQSTSDLNHDRIVAVMGGVAPGKDAPRAASTRSEGTEVLRVDSVRDAWLHDVRLSVHAGEIVGLSGLDGQGQQQLLRYLWRNRKGKRSVRFSGGVSFVTGDRQTSGVFPLWTVGQNIGIGIMAQTSHRGVLSLSQEQRVVEDWMKRLSVRGTPTTSITALSGGNQQKALIARALASRSQTVLLNDPFRGVDIETKQQVYRLMREETAKGRSFLWFTTENAELVECDRVYVMSDGRVAAELGADEISEEAVIGASFERG